MTVELKPETERLVQEELKSGHFQSLDELIVEGVQAWREKHPLEVMDDTPRKSIYELLTQPPFAGSALVIERQIEYPRRVELD
jgi:Arc/MetJ-type ribon-helix-helix transcriptional regulator